MTAPRTPPNADARARRRPCPRRCDCRDCRLRAGHNRYTGGVTARRVLGPDELTLRALERWSGLPYEQWATPEGRAWQLYRGVYLQELWSERMRVRAQRRAWYAALRQRRAAEARGAISA